jgi:PAS domain S-box-containing protein
VDNRIPTSYYIRRVSGLGSLLIFLAGMGWPLPVPPSGPLKVTTVYHTKESSNYGPPVTLRGTVTAFSGWKNSFFLQDETGAISIDRVDEDRVEPGDKVEVTGSLHPGLFAPVVVGSHIQAIAHVGLPAARSASFKEMANGSLDSQLVKVTGIIHAARRGEIWGKEVLFLDLHTPEGVITVHVAKFLRTKLDYLVDSTVEITGVCGTIFNDRRQLVGLRLFVSDLANVMVKRPATDLGQLPFSPISSLMTFGGLSSEHRVKITGTVSYHGARNELYVQEGRTAILVHTIEPGSWEPGTQVDAWGFAENFGPMLSLRSATVQFHRSQSQLQPIHISAADAIRTENGFLQAPYNGLLVSLEGQVVELLPNSQNQLWSFRDGQAHFLVQLAGANGLSHAIALEPGTRVRITGICVADRDENQEFRSFQILLRSTKDIHILREPYWNSSFCLLLGILSATLLGSFLIWMFHRRQANSSKTIAVDDATAKLRLRFRKVSELLGISAFAVGLIIVAGWIFDIRILQLRSTSAIPMPNAALAILAAGVAVVLASRQNNRLSVGLCSISGYLTTSIGLLTLFEYVTSRDLRIDRLLFGNPASIPDTANAGRMAIATALCICLIGIATLLIRGKRNAGVGQILALGAGVIGLLNLINRLYGSDNHYGVGAHATIAIPTACGIVVLCLAIFLARPDCGAMQSICSSGTGGLLARRLIPFALLAPIVLGWIRLQGQLAGLYDTRFGLALFALSNVVCFGFVLWISATSLNHLDFSRSQAIRELRDRDSKIEMIFQTTSMGDWTWNAATDEVIAHPVVWKLYGVAASLGTAPTAWLQDRHHPDDAEHIAQELRNAVLQHRPINMEFRVVQPDGSIRWLACRGTSVYDKDGRATQTNGINVDITDRKLAELRLRESETLFRQLADAMPQIVWTAKKDGTIDYYNRRWYDYTGALSLAASWEECVHPDDLPGCREAWDASVEKGTFYQVEVRLRRHDATYRWHLARALPIEDADGNSTQWFGTSTDINDSKQASAELLALNEQLESRVSERSAALAESERRHRLLVAGVGDYAIFMLDADGRVTTWNIGAERIKQYSSSEIIGQHASVFYPGDGSAEQSWKRDIELARSDGQFRAEGWRVRKDQSRFWANVLITPIHNDAGELTGYSNVTRDLTDQRRAEQLLLSERTRAEDANRAKSSFLAAMSHEIRTPMNAILGMADLLWETELSRLQREYVARFRRAGTNLLTIINDILDLSKIESGRFELESINFRLSDVVERTIELMSPRAEMKKIDLAAHTAPETPNDLIGDPGRLQQILNNIIGNAVKFTEHGGVTLVVRSHSDGRGGHLHFSVTDTGIGIPFDKLSTVFEDFTQAESSTTRRFGGTGLGLGICRRLVQRMGGNLTVESVFGQGSTFSFNVVFSLGEEMPAIEEKEVADFSGCRVLVVDDNPTNRLILSEMCAGWGMAVTQATRAMEACELVEAARAIGNPFSLVLLDYIMPGMKGIEALRRISELDPNLPVILSSSDSQPGDITKAKALGAAAYLTKPIRRSELLANIMTALRTEETASANVAVPTGSVPLSEGSLKILIAEDSEDNRFLVSAYLKTRPYELTFVENGALACEAFKHEQFGLVLMDVQMPVMDGLSATAAIRAFEEENKRQPTPIVALTANALTEDLERSQAAGCNAHLSKPISKEKLIAAIETYRAGAVLQAVSGASPTCEMDVPEGLEELSRNYVLARREELLRLLPVAPDQSLVELRTFGHNLKGTGASFGFEELTRLGAAIEGAAKASNTRLLTTHLKEAKEYVEYAAKTLGLDGQ